MLKNYLKAALRSLNRFKGYSFIHITGFAIGMACCLLIAIYILQEMSYDRYHRDAERSCRIVIDIKGKSANRTFALVSPTVAPVLRSDYPQVETAARALIAWTPRLVKRDGTGFYEDRFMVADPELFDIFTIPFVQGTHRESLSRPNTLVVSQRTARKYFGDEDPLGKTLEINDREYEITGVVRNSPENTHLKYDLIASMKTLKDWDEMSNWHSTMFYTYLKLRPGVRMDAFSRQIRRMADPYVGDRLKRWGSTYEYFLQPISSIHLESHLSYETEPPGSHAYLIILFCVGLFILLIASLNFVNLSTARAASRAKEVGLRKVVGAQKLQLVTQFCGESLVVAYLSLASAMVLVSILISSFNDLTGLSLDFSVLLAPGVLVSLVGGAFALGLAAGLYPAFVLSAFRPAATLQGISRTRKRGFSLRTGLVVVQFCISAVLIIGAFTMVKQFNFMKNQHLGFKKEQKLILPLRGGIDIQKNFPAVKDLFSKHPSIQGITVSSSVPGREISNFAIALVGENDSKNQSMYHLYFDDDFIPEYGIDMKAGRAFRKEMKTDFMGAFLINEAAVKAFGWTRPEEALGKRLQTGHGGRVNPIIGVTRDFHYRGLQSQIEPLVMEFLPWTFRYVTLSIDVTRLEDVLGFVKTQWKNMWPAHPFEYFFLDADFDRQYRADEQIGHLFGIFTFLGGFIACLGLLGLAAFTIQMRVKEIGIRKVLGASTPGITFGIIKDFLKWVVLANIIAWPVAYLIMRHWLQDFAYRTQPGIGIFIFSSVLSILVALFTVSYQSIRAATANPVDSLRYE